MATINVKDAAGATVALEKPLAPSRAPAATSRPVALSDEDKAVLDESAASLAQMPTESGGHLQTIKENTDDVSTETTLNLVLAKLADLETLYTTLADGVFVRLVNPADDTEVTYSDVSLVRPDATKYETVAASQSAQALGATGATGDYLSHVWVQPTSTTVGAVTILDNAVEVHAYPGGTVSAALYPFCLDIKALSVSGAWKVTTGAGVKCTAYGNFT